MKTKNMKSKWSLKKPLFIKKSDKRYKKYVKQLKRDGFCDCETWCLSGAIAEFILPRLKRFKVVNNGFPGGLTEEKWDEIIDKMIFAFDYALTYEDALLNDDDSKIAFEKHQEGMKLFSEYFFDLWW